MIFIILFILTPLCVLFSIPFLRVRERSIVVFTAILLNAVLSSYFAIPALMGDTVNFSFPGSIVTGPIRIQIDALSGWFMLIINFIFITGSFYGSFYMKTYSEQKNNLSLHSIMLVLMHSAILSLCVLQNSIAFLVAWEMMALSAFLTIIFEHTKITTIRAGINYIIQSHVSIVFLMLGFIWMAFKTGSYDFNAITIYTANHQGGVSLILFLCFFIAFAIKAGFVPFHTWLPYAHPAAPAHISGIMSGVLIKIGIYGILRMLLVIQPDFKTVGYIILLISLISGLYGVMLAIVQHNLKKLLAYHSIENIGIIGIGIGLGCIGLGSSNLILASVGFAGALLHTLNHALFKSLLFFTAGNVYQATHTLQIEQLGGLIKKMPQTATLFLIAAIAICGIPPFNGFISEFLIYTGLYNWLQNANLISLLVISFSVLALVLIGGLALMCFTKAFGIVFLGTPRHEFNHQISEVPFLQLLPLYIITFGIVLIGLFPKLFINLLIKPVSLFTNINQITLIPFQLNLIDTLQSISWAAWGLILLIVIIFIFRKLITQKYTKTIASTWGCGFIAPTPKIQYTANSFVRTYSKLFSNFLLIPRHEEEIEGVFPTNGFYESHPYDKLEKWLIDAPIKTYKSILGRFSFLQNGNLQFYILYGIIFIISIICIPFFYEQIIAFIKFLNQL